MSINRRSFVQTAAAAVGGAASLAGEASAQGTLQLAQAQVAPTTAHTCPGPYKPYSLTPGEQSERNYQFLKELFNPATEKTFRDAWFNYSDAELRRELRGWLDLDLPADTKILLVDVQYGRTKGTINTTTDCWYVLIMPPVPRGYLDANGNPEKGYVYEMTWEAAWHHAIVYGYGM